MFELRDFSATAVEAHLMNDIDNVSDSFSIDDATGWPTGGSNGDFMVRIEAEVIRCASRTGNTCQVAGSGRGYDGTAAANHQATSVAEHVLSKIDLYEANVAASETVGKATGVGQILVSDGVNSFSPLFNGTDGLPLVAGGTYPIYNQLTNIAYADSSISIEKMGTASVGSDELLDENVINSKLGPQSVTESKLHTSVAGAGLGGGGGAALYASVDNETIDIAGDNIRVADEYRWQPGDLKTSARGTPTTGWLLCDGSAVSRVDYVDLFSAIATAYGVGDGVDTFNVPDYRGRVIVGAGTGSGLTARARGDVGGEQSHLLITNEMPTHTHIQQSHNHTQDPHGHDLHTSYNDLAAGIARVYGVGYQALGRDSNNTLDIIDITATNQAATAVNNSEGGGEDHNNMQPFGVANVFIKT